MSRTGTSAAQTYVCRPTSEVSPGKGRARILPPGSGAADLPAYAAVGTRQAVPGGATHREEPPPIHPENASALGRADAEDVAARLAIRLGDHMAKPGREGFIAGGMHQHVCAEMDQR